MAVVAAAVLAAAGRGQRGVRRRPFGKVDRSGEDREVKDCWMCLGRMLERGDVVGVVGGRGVSGGR